MNSPYRAMMPQVPDSPRGPYRSKMRPSPTLEDVLLGAALEQSRGPAMRNPVPEWLRRENDSVLDSTTEKAIKKVARWFGADDLNSQVMGLLNPTEAAAGPLAKAIEAVASKVKGIKAFHGSPHDFDQFSMSKIGTGEGAQAYGHGLYFAENEGVARDYQRKLSQFGQMSEMPEDMTTSVLLDGKVVSGKTPSNQLTPQQRAALSVHYERGNQQRAIQSIEKEVLPYVTGPARDLELETLAALKAEDFTGRVKPFTGRMYEVQINADPNDFLDWDAPLSQQSEKVRALARERGVDGSEEALYESAVRSGLGKYARDYAKKQAYEPTGEHVYAALGRNQVGSDTLRQAGIPGIKYLDQGSRAAGSGTRNYVVFDEKLISIVKKYGISGALGAGLINELQARQLQQQGYQ